MRSFFSLLLAVLLTPVAAGLVAAIPYWDILEVTNPVEMIRIGQHCVASELFASEVSEFCSALREFNYLGVGALAVAALGVWLVVGTALIACITGWSRILLAISFPMASVIAITIIGLIVLGQTALLAGGIYLLEAYFLETVHPFIILAVAAIGGLAGLAILMNVFSMLNKATTSVIGVAVQPVEAPHIHRTVLNIARDIGTHPPRNIILGFDPTFFATTSRVSTPFSKSYLRGESLYLSLPLMRVLSEDETRSIIGHELAHFSGGDTAYSKRFAPAYTGLLRARSGLVDQDENSSVLAWPALATIDYVLGIFSRAERKIGRAREIRADKIGSDVGSPEGLSRALVKLSVLSAIWNTEYDDMISRVQKGRFSRNLSCNFVERARYEIDHDKVAGLAALSLDSEIEHPTDTHPATRIRIEALDVDPESLLDIDAFKSSLFPERTIIARSDSIDRIEEALTDAYQHFIVRLAGIDESDQARDDSAFSNLLSMWLAKMASIDGKVDDSEIEIAQSEAYKYDSTFDATSFREHCRHYEDIPPVEKLIYWANNMLTEAGAARLREILRKIAEADDVLHDAEIDLLERIDDELVGVSSRH